MVFAVRGTSRATTPIGATWKGGGHAARDLADSILEIGLLRPLVIDAHGEVLDGRKRAQALSMIGAATAPAIRVDLPPQDVTQAAAIRACCKAIGMPVPAFTGASRATLDRVERVFAVAEDATLPLHVRTVAAEGVSQLAAGEPANGVLSKVTAALEDHTTTSRYPELAQLSHMDAMRMASYLDQIEDPATRELELSVLRLTLGAPEVDSQALSMSVYTHMQDLARTVDVERAEEVAHALAAAISGRALTPALRERCIEVADQLERTAAGIRTAMTLELETT